MSLTKYSIVRVALFPSQADKPSDVGSYPDPDPKNCDQTKDYQGSWDKYAGGLAMATVESALMSAGSIIEPGLEDAKKVVSGLVGRALSNYGKSTLVPSDVGASHYRPVATGGHEMVMQIRHRLADNSTAPISYQYAPPVGIPITCYHYILLRVE